MSILKQVARAICEADTEAPEPDAKIYIGMKTAKAWKGHTDMATAAITAFLEAVAKPDKDGRTWRMVPDEATEDMLVNSTMSSEVWARNVWSAMKAAAPPFMLDGETT